jgi:hypothetical protein
MCDSILTIIYAGKIFLSKECLASYNPDKRKSAYKFASKGLF